MAKKKEMDWIWNGYPIKLITKRNSDGEIIEIMEKPKMKYINPETYISGCHLFRDYPDQNHYDHYYNGSTWKEYGDSVIPRWSFINSNTIRFDFFQKIHELKTKKDKKT